MDCAYFENLIEMQAEQTLTDEDRHALQAHLCRCPQCRALQEAYAFLSHELQEDLAEAPEALVGSVMDEIWADKRRRMQRKNRRRWTGILSAAACVALAVGLSWSTLAPKGGAMEMAAEAAPAAAAAPTEAMAADEEAPAESRAALPEPVAEVAAAEPETAPLPAPESNEAPAAAAKAAADEPAEAAMPMLLEEAAAPVPAAELPAVDSAAANTENDEKDAGVDAEAEAATGDAEAPLPAATSVPEAAPAQLYDAAGVLLGELDADGLLGSICLDGGESRSADELSLADYSVRCGEREFEFYLFDGALWWREGRSAELHRSPADEAALLALIN